MPSSAAHASTLSSCSEIVTIFLRTRSPGSEQDYFHALSALRPDRLTTLEIATIVRWVQENRTFVNTPHPHLNVFGTGGDKTINITSLACCVASRFVPIVKVGTPAVLSNFGSADFFGFFCNHPLYVPQKSDAAYPFASGSRYIPLSAFGFPYNSTLRNARRRLFKNGIPDIYKIVFPFSSYTAPTMQINGASSSLYFAILTKLSQHFNRDACIVRSMHDIDELMPGANEVYIHTPIVKEYIHLDLPSASRTQLKSILSETKAPSQSPKLLRSLLAGRADPVLKRIIAWNAALYVTCFKQTWHSANSFRQSIDADFEKIVGSL